MALCKGDGRKKSDLIMGGLGLSLLLVNMTIYFVTLQFAHFCYLTNHNAVIGGVTPGPSCSRVE